MSSTYFYVLIFNSSLHNLTFHIFPSMYSYIYLFIYQISTLSIFFTKHVSCFSYWYRFLYRNTNQNLVLSGVFDLIAAADRLKMYCIDNNSNTHLNDTEESREYLFSGNCVWLIPVLGSPSPLSSFPFVVNNPRLIALRGNITDQCAMYIHRYTYMCACNLPALPVSPKKRSK